VGFVWGRRANRVTETTHNEDFNKN
jgi:hypothetical protein